jgi:hypothetical protein
MTRAAWATVHLEPGIATTADSTYLRLLSTGALGRRSGRGLAVIVEPLHEEPATAEIAQRVLALLQHAAWQITGQATLDHLGQVLTDAFEAANRWLLSLNAGRERGAWHRFGAACALFRGHDLLIAQVLPSQVLVGQEQELYAFPGGDAPPGDERAPLGQYRSVQPSLYYTRLAPGDTVVLGHQELCAVLAEHWPEVVLVPEPERIVRLLEELAWERGATRAQAIAIAVGSERQPSARPLRRLADVLVHLLPEEMARRLDAKARTKWLGRAVDPADETGQTSQGVNGGVETQPEAQGDWEPHARPHRFDDDSPPPDEPWADEATPAGARWDPSASPDGDAAEGDVGYRAGRRRTLVDLLAGLAIAFVAAVLGFWQLAARRRRRLAPPPDDGTFGLPRLQRFDDTIQFPDLGPVRRQLPRLPVSRLTGLVAVSLIGVLTSALALSIHSDRERARQERFEVLVQGAVQERTLAERSSDPVIARAYLSTADARLDAAAALGLDPERVDEERAAVRMARDRLLKIHRLESVQVLGGVPPAPEGVTPRLFFGNGQLYLLTDALYRLDSGGTKLIKLLEPGAVVGGAPVGMLLGAAWGEGAPVAFDGTSAYRFDPATAQWSRVPVGTFGAPYTGVAAIGTFDGNLYLLLPEPGQILKFLAGAYESQPQDWTGGQFLEYLSGAVDMEIDGRIYVLEPDGTVATFFRGALEGEATPQVDPPVVHAVALSMQPDRPYRYVADREGRILRLAPDGTLVQQFLAADDAPPLGPIRDLVVDDVLGIAYVLTDQALLAVRLPAPMAGP